MHRCLTIKTFEKWEVAYERVGPPVRACALSPQQLGTGAMGVGIVEAFVITGSFIDCLAISPLIGASHIFCVETKGMTLRLLFNPSWFEI
jgi:hypothetical protein